MNVRDYFACKNKSPDQTQTGACGSYCFLLVIAFTVGAFRVYAG